MSLKSLFLFAAVLLCGIVFSQNLPFYKQQIDTLCSEYFAGRGYHKNGDLKAASYISSFFESNDLKAIDNDKDYLQKYGLSVNTIQDVELKIDNRTLKLGSDFIVKSSSPSVEGDFSIVTITSRSLDKKSKRENLQSLTFSNSAVALEKVLLLRIKKEYPNLYTKISQAKILIELTDGPLISAPSQKLGIQPLLYVSKNTFNSKAKHLSLSLDTKYYDNYITQNVVGLMEGESDSDSVIIICAHYDHLGEIGNNIRIQGANDNASGIGMMLDLIKHFQQNPPEKSIAFIAFGGEEVGLLGSKFYVENPLIALANTKVVVNLDLMGAGSQGITVVNAYENESYVEVLSDINLMDNYVEEIKQRDNAPNSDHYYFTKHNTPAIFIYSLGEVGGYHDIHDNPESLEYESYDALFKLIYGFLNNISH